MTAQVEIPSVEALVARVEPVIRQYAARSEAERRLAPELVDALNDAGLFRVWVPRAYGGLEMDPLTSFRLFEAVARIDGSVGWVVSNCAFACFFSQVFPDQGTSEIFGAPRAIAAGVAFPPQAAVPADGGYRVTGQWPFGSACHFADWLGGPCLIMDREGPRLGPDGNPALVMVFFPRGEAEILDTWHTLGMRGTGSADFRVNDVFVPEHLSFMLGPFDKPGTAYTGPLYRIGVWIDALRIAITVLGIAGAAVDDFVGLAGAKVPSFFQTALADRSRVQDGVARARAQVEAARSYIYSTVREAWQYVQSGPRITVNEGVPLGLAASFGVHSAVQAMDIVYELAGTTAIREEHPFQQRFRDVQTLRQHAIASVNRFESLGKIMLGRQSDWAFYYV